jgi:hypothetical protein
VQISEPAMLLLLLPLLLQLLPWPLLLLSLT